MTEIAVFDENSRIIRIKIRDSASTTGAGKTGLAYNTSGLIISTIASSEATAVVYTQAATHIETISTLGTYAAPSADCCRFKEVDATNHPGLYEIQLPDARYSVSGAKSLIVSVLGATGMVPCDIKIPLTVFDLYDADPSVDATKIGGATQTGRDLGASVLISSGTGAGQLDVTSGVIKANLAQILGTALTETAGYLAAGFKKFFNVATPVMTVESVNQSADNDTKITDIKAKTDMQPTVWYSA